MCAFHRSSPRRNLANHSTQRLDHLPTIVHTKALAEAGDDDLIRHANLQLMTMGRQERPSIYVYRLFRHVFLV